MRISAEIPNGIDIGDYNLADFGQIMFHFCKDIILATNNPNLDEIIEAVKRGDTTFLYDTNGRFLENSMEIVTEGSDASLH